MKEKRGYNLLVKNIGLLLPMKGDGAEEGIREAAVLIRNGEIVYAGSQKGCPSISDIETLDAKGGLVTPGLVECHTHLVFVGSRADEFEARGKGLSYEEITRRGGGILSTVRAVRDASKEMLFAASLPRAWWALSQGITTLEIKSGYGLSLDTEIRMLEVIKELEAETPLDIIPTFMGAHTYPPDVNRKTHLDAIVNEWIPKVAEANLAKFCDVFCEAVAFSPAEAERILVSAKEHGMKLKVHADQLSRSGGSLLAARLGAVSADHLDFADPSDLIALKESQVVAVLLPGCSISLGTSRFPAGRFIWDMGLTVALSTDFNPGSSTTLNLPLMGTLAMAYMGLNHMEVWKAITINAAQALDISDRVGAVYPGYQGDLVIFPFRDPRDVFYYYGLAHASIVIKRGKVIVERSEKGEVKINY